MSLSAAVQLYVVLFFIYDQPVWLSLLLLLVLLLLLTLTPARPSLALLMSSTLNFANSDRRARINSGS